MTVSDDEIFERAAALPLHDVEADVAERIRHVALAEFRSGSRAGVTALRPRSTDLWSRFVEPALIVVSVVSYLTWTASTLTALHAASAAGSAERGASE